MLHGNPLVEQYFCDMYVRPAPVAIYWSASEWLGGRPVVMVGIGVPGETPVQGQRRDGQSDNVIQALLGG